ncbi:hypothetical protein DH2020_015218 [Rehmannia glutinosa]|uniref:Transposase (putative) gypsy type domain-containing protein n=1 Tax=Rehmannia glutinosa TaxID=99300 RepID=A0ABR0WUL9_REHGL
MASSSTNSDPHLTDLVRWSDELDTARLRDHHPELSDPEATESDSSSIPLSPIEIRASNPLAPPEVDNGFSHSAVTAQSLYNLRRNACIPSLFKLSLPSYTDRPFRPPPQSLTFFVGQLDGGLRFPINSFFSEVSSMYKIPLNQLTPNSFRIIAGFLIITKFLSIDPSTDLFFALFQVKSSTPKGLFYITARNETNFLRKYPTSNKFWKDRYFFVTSAEPWPFPHEWVWSLPPQQKHDPKKRPLDLQDLIHILTAIKYDLSKIITPSLLHYSGVSPEVVPLECDIGIMLSQAVSQKAEARKKVSSLARPSSSQTGGAIVGLPVSGSRSPRTTRPDSAEDVLAEFSIPKNPTVLIGSRRGSSDTDLPLPKKTRVGTSSGEHELIRSPIDTPNQTWMTGIPSSKIPIRLWRLNTFRATPYPRSSRFRQALDADGSTLSREDQARAHVKLSSLIARARVGFANPALVRELETLKKDNKKLKAKEAKLLTEVRELKDKLLRAECSVANSDIKIKDLGKENATLKAELKDNLVHAREERIEIDQRDFIKSMEGRALVGKVREKVKKCFLSSDEFIDILSTGVIHQYEFAFDQAELQLQEKGIYVSLDREGLRALMQDPEGFVFSKIANEVNLSSDEAFVNSLNDSSWLADLKVLWRSSGADRARHQSGRSPLIPGPDRFLAQIDLLCPSTVPSSRNEPDLTVQDYASENLIS